MIRTRITGSVAAVLLVAASVFGGAVAANAVPPSGPPVIDPSFDGAALTMPAVPVFFGSAPDYDTDVAVTLTPLAGGAPTSYCTDSTSPYDTWGSCSGTAIPAGVYDVTAVGDLATDPGYDPSAPSAPVRITVYGTAPVVVTSQPPVSGSDATPGFAGTGPALGSVTVSGDGVSCTTPVAPNGTWSCDSVPVGASGPLNPLVSATDHFGGSPSSTGVTPFTIVAPPAPTVDQIFTPWTTSTPQRDIQGNKDADVDYLQVYTSPDGVTWAPYCQSTGVIGATIWFCDPPFGSLTMGSNLVAAIAFNEAGDASAMGPPITIELIPPPTITSPADGAFTNDPTPSFSGTTPAGTDATVYDLDAFGTICSGPVTAGAYTCDSLPRPDGPVNYFVYVVPGDAISSESRTLIIDTVAPAAPVITGPGSMTTATHPVITGTAEPFSTITVYRDGIPAPCQEGTVVASSTGSWSCSSIAGLSAGSAFGFGAVQADRAGNLSDPGVPSTQLTVTILSAAAAPMASPAGPTPAAAPTSPIVFQPWTFTFRAGGDEFEPGDTTQLTGSALPPGAAVDVEFHSTPVELGSTVVQADGTFSMLVSIPEDATAGEHRFVVLVTPVEGLPSTQEQAVTVVLPAETMAEPVAEARDATPAGIDRSDPAAPSSLTDSIDTIGSILSNPAVVAGAILAGLALLLLVAFPAELLNATISEQYPRFSRRLPKAPWLERLTNRLETAPLPGGIAITLVAALIFGFADPGFGFDVTSLRLVLACAIALFVVGYLASSITGLIIRRRWELATTMELKPLGLVLTVVGVVVSRLLDFSPGFLIGLLLGIGLVGSSTPGQRAKATLVQAAVVFALAILGWTGYSILTAAGAGDDFGSALALDTMVAITVEGLTALFIGLLPFRFLDGATVFARSKAVWAAAYAVAAAAFVLIVVPTAWGEPSGSLWLWVGIVGGFATLAIGVYLYFRYLAKPLDDEEERLDASHEREPSSESVP